MLFRNASLSLKLTIIMALASTLALLIATGGFLYFDLTAFRSKMASDLQTQAQIIGSNSSAALTFRDSAAATETLKSLTANDQVVAAAIYTPDGKLFASWARTKKALRELPTRAEPDGVIHGNDQVGVFASVYVARERAGSVYINSTLASWRQRRTRYSEIVGLLILVGVGFTLVIGSQLQRVVTLPIQELAAAMRLVAKDEDYSRRVSIRAGGEIGDLADGFNTMIAELEQQRHALRGANEVLETRVQERTQALQFEIGERILAEKTLERNQEALEEFFENATVGLLWLGPDGTILRANAMELRTLGYFADEYVGRYFGEFHADPQQAQEILQRLWNGETLSNYETLMVDHEGHLRNIVIDSNVLWNEGVFVHARCFTRDVTALKEAEQAERARVEAERASKAKSEFLSRMSHELRTPMNAILGFAQLLQMDVLSPDQAESVDQIRSAGDHLLRLINEVLDISRIEAGALTISKEPVSILEVASEVRSLIQPLADQQSVHVMLELEPDLHTHVLADRQRLTQVLLNLVSNAVKYNRPEGSVWIREVAIKDGWSRIEVVDTGRGIHADRAHSMFTPFERLGAEETPIEGTGLGLALSKRLVEAMGGTIGFESRSTGAMFYVDLPQIESPLARVDPEMFADQPQTVGENLAQKTILLVEDNLSNVRLMERVLATKPNVRLIASITGSLGFELAMEHQPDLILLDLNLPDCHGSDLLTRFRSTEKLEATPVVVVSADATQAQVAKLLAAGAYKYLTKPLVVRELLDTLDEILSDPISKDSENRVA